MNRGLWIRISVGTIALLLIATATVSAAVRVRCASDGAIRAACCCPARDQPDAPAVSSTCCQVETSVAGTPPVSGSVASPRAGGIHVAPFATPPNVASLARPGRGSRAALGGACGPPVGSVLLLTTALRC
jgi:hypothetical protein